MISLLAQKAFLVWIGILITSFAYAKCEFWAQLPLHKSRLEAVRFKIDSIQASLENFRFGDRNLSAVPSLAARIAKIRARQKALKEEQGQKIDAAQLAKKTIQETLPLIKEVSQAIYDCDQECDRVYSHTLAVLEKMHLREIARLLHLYQFLLEALIDDPFEKLFNTSLSFTLTLPDMPTNNLVFMRRPMGPRTVTIQFKKTDKELPDTKPFVLVAKSASLKDLEEVFYRLDYLATHGHIDHQQIYLDPIYREQPLFPSYSAKKLEQSTALTGIIHPATFSYADEEELPEIETWKLTVSLNSEHQNAKNIVKFLGALILYGNMSPLETLSSDPH